MYQLSFYVPESHLESVKTAIFAAGAGTLGDYSHVCWQTLGEGQFKPLSGSKPFVGEQDNLTKVPEYKVELLCEEPLIRKVIDALIKTHPYEEPAYQLIKLEDI